jgi:hypothetical protein
MKTTKQEPPLAKNSHNSTPEERPKRTKTCFQDAGGKIESGGLTPADLKLCPYSPSANGGIGVRAYSLTRNRDAASYEGKLPMREKCSCECGSLCKRCDQRLLRPAQKVFEKRHVLKKRTTKSGQPGSAKTYVGECRKTRHSSANAQ